MRTLPIDETLFEYLLDHSLREQPAQAALREATRTHPHAGMQIAPDQGQFMALLVKLIGAQRTIEIGTFTGYSGERWFVDVNSDETNGVLTTAIHPR